MITLTNAQIKQLDAIGTEHQRLGDVLYQLEHRKWLAELPEGYVPLLRDMPPPQKLYLTTQEKAELEGQILHTRINLIRLAMKFHEVKYCETPAWCTQTLAKLQGQVQQLFSSQQATQ